MFTGFHVQEIVSEYQKLRLVLMRVRHGGEDQPSEQLRNKGEVGVGTNWS